MPQSLLEWRKNLAGNRYRLFFHRSSDGPGKSVVSVHIVNRKAVRLLRPSNLKFADWAGVATAS
jgi:hypothetical protein